jgi:hypothetical protein
MDEIIDVILTPAEVTEEFRTELRVSKGSSRRHCKDPVEVPHPVAFVMASYKFWYFVIFPSE